MCLDAPLDDSDAIAQGQSDALCAWSNAAATCVCMKSGLGGFMNARLVRLVAKCGIPCEGQASRDSEAFCSVTSTIEWLVHQKHPEVCEPVSFPSGSFSIEMLARASCDFRWGCPRSDKEVQPYACNNQSLASETEIFPRVQSRHPHCGYCHFLLWDPTRYSCCCPTMAMERGKELSSPKIDLA